MLFTLLLNMWNWGGGGVWYCTLDPPSQCDWGVLVECLKMTIMRKEV